MGADDGASSSGSGGGAGSGGSGGGGVTRQVLDTAAQLVKSAATTVGVWAHDASDYAGDLAGVGRAHSEQAWTRVEALQEQALHALNDGAEWAAARPQYAYPAAAGAALVLLPGLRRFAYRLTIGRLRNPEAVVSVAEARLAALGAKADEFAAEAAKLQGRAAHAHEEMVRGRAKLRAARQELQRLEAGVGKSERLTASVLDDLRGMARQSPRATELRSEAALKLAQLRQQRAALQKEVRWIVKEDV